MMQPRNQATAQRLTCCSAAVSPGCCACCGTMTGAPGAMSETAAAAAAAAAAACCACCVAASGAAAPGPAAAAGPSGGRMGGRMGGTMIGMRGTMPAIAACCATSAGLCCPAYCSGNCPPAGTKSAMEVAGTHCRVGRAGRAGGQASGKGERREAQSPTHPLVGLRAHLLRAAVRPWQQAVGAGAQCAHLQTRFDSHRPPATHLIHHIPRHLAASSQRKAWDRLVWVVHIPGGGHWQPRRAQHRAARRPGLEGVCPHGAPPVRRLPRRGLQRRAGGRAGAVRESRAAMCKVRPSIKAPGALPSRVHAG